MAATMPGTPAMVSRKRMRILRRLDQLWRGEDDEGAHSHCSGVLQEANQDTK